jgi:hypothetical protein
VRSVGLDVHLDFCEATIVEEVEVRAAGRIEIKPEQIELCPGAVWTYKRTPECKVLNLVRTARVPVLW